MYEEQRDQATHEEQRQMPNIDVDVIDSDGNIVEVVQTVDVWEHDIDEQLIKYCGDGNLEKVAGCIAQGANVNLFHSVRSSPLVNAAAYGKIDVARFLLESGAQPNFRGKVCPPSPD